MKYRTALFGVLLSAAALNVAVSDPIKGKTIKGRYSWTVCGTRCIGPSSASFNIYVSSLGNVFDYSTSDAGVESKLSVPYKPGVYWAASGNSLLLHSGNLTQIYSVQGDTCSLSIRKSDAKFNVTMESCSVVEGNPGR
ncbi:MAG: hypothetical protein NTZ72_09875 [Afipia sp.]|nr:hypothetical protein [Afipia sp.]